MTPPSLRSLAALAGELEIAGLYVKDESFRFGLNAFKELGTAMPWPESWRSAPGSPGGGQYHSDRHVHLCNGHRRQPRPWGALGRPESEAESDDVHVQRLLPGAAGQHPKAGSLGGDYPLQL